MPALREPRFRRLLVGWSPANFGDSALYLSLGIWAKDLTAATPRPGWCSSPSQYRSSCP